MKFNKTIIFYIKKLKIDSNPKKTYHEGVDVPNFI